MRFVDLSLERKIFVLSLLICLVPVLAFLFLTNTGSRLTFQETIGNELNQDARQIGMAFDQFIARSSRRLSYRFAHPALRPAGLNANREFELADPDAILRMDSTGSIQTELFGQGLSPWRSQIEANYFYFQDYLQLEPGSLPFEGAFQDFPLLIPGSTAPLMLGIFVLPTDDGYTFLLYRIERIIEAFRQREMQLPDLFMIFSSNGRLVYTTQPVSEEHQLEIARQLNPALTSSRYFQIRQGQRIYLMSPYIARTMQRQFSETQLGSYWIFLATYDMEPFLRPQETLFSLSWIIALAMVLVLLFLASYTAKFITEPLLRLRRQADQIAGGQLEVQATVHSRDEIGELAQAFNQMATRLRQSYSNLEDRIQESQLRADHINVINQIIFAINQAHDLDSIFRITSLEMKRIFQYDAFWLAIRTETGDLHVTHIDPEGMIALFDQSRIPRRNSLHGRVLEVEETVHAEIGPQHRTEFYETRIFNAEGLQSYLISPLPGRQRVIGTITVASAAPDAFNTELAEIITSLSASIAVALEQMDMVNRISQFAQEMERKVEVRSQELALATQKLIQTEKYFATGRMAGNLAHEINNPLEIIKNYLQLVKNRLTAAGGGRRASDPNIDHVRIIDEEVNRIARLVRQMMDLHRPVEQAVQPLDLNALFEEILALMEDTLGRNKITVVRDLQPGLPQPVASRDLIRQVLINLMRNAQDAMESGGTLSLKTRALGGDDVASGDSAVEITIQDTGHGISEENMNTIFDPFFTTKSQEKGTGLGLCVSYSIVRMYAGNIEVTSAEGKGTCVKVTLPVHRDKNKNRDALPKGNVIPIISVDSH